MSEFDSASASFPRLNSPRVTRKLRFAFAAALLGGLGCGVGGEPITDSPTNGAAPGAGGQGSGATVGNSGASSSGANSGTGATGQGGGGPGPVNGGSGSGTGGVGNATGGTMGGGATPGSGGSTTGTMPPPPVGGELSNCQTPAPRLIRRLNKEQFRNTLVAAFNGDTSVPKTDVIANPYDLFFHVDADKQVVRDLDAGLIMDYADEVADWAVTNNKLGSFASCSSVDDNCGKQFIEAAALKLMREPISSDRYSKYLALFKAETTFKDAATTVVSAMIQSPYMLYRREMGAADAGAFKLTQYEIASELAYFLTDSPPDSQLLDAAKNNQLSTQQNIDTQAARLLSLPAAKVALRQFVEGWLEIEKLRIKTKENKVYDLTMQMREAMLSETTETFIDAFFNGGDVGKLFTTKDTFVNKDLGSFYGLNGANSTTPTKVSIAGTNRPSGVLGQAAFLTTHAQPENSSPTQRGIVVLSRLLCESIPAVPQGLNTALAAPGVTKTNRERYAAHSAQEPCKTCHTFLDPAGLLFENYDGFGRYRAEEGGSPVDSSGGLVGMPEGDLKMTGPEGLNDYLAKSDKVRACLVRYWSYYAHGRDNWADKKCNDDSVRREAAANGNTLKSVLMGILHAPSFTRRVQDQ